MSTYFRVCARINIFLESGSFRPWVVLAWSFRPGLFRPNFGGESIRPTLVGRFGRESFRPWVVSAQEVCVCVWGGTLNFSAYVSPSPLPSQT